MITDLGLHDLFQDTVLLKGLHSLLKQQGVVRGGAGALPELQGGFGWGAQPPPTAPDGKFRMVPVKGII